MDDFVWLDVSTAVGRDLVRHQSSRGCQLHTQECVAVVYLHLPNLRFALRQLDNAHLHIAGPLH